MIMCNEKLEKRYYHYIYKIIFLCGYPTGRYYLGKRTYRGKNLQNDPYKGSGNFCRAYFKKYGGIYGETYLKEIIEINPSRTINREREKVIIGDLWYTDPLCMNQRHGGDGGAILGHETKSSTKIKIAKAVSKPILQYDYKGNLIKEWPNIDSASKYYKIRKTNIADCCKKRILIYHDCIWRFTNDPLTENDILILNAPVISKFTLDGDFVENYSSIHFAAVLNNITDKNVLNCCEHKKRTAKEFTYRYWEEVKNLKHIELPKAAKCGRKVNCYTKDGIFIKTYPGLKDAARAVANNEITGYKNILYCCKGNKKSAYGYVWRYASERIAKVTDIEPLWQSLKVPVVQFDLDGNYIAIFESASAAARSISERAMPGHITKNCRGENLTAYGYKWKFKDDFNVNDDDKCLN